MEGYLVIRTEILQPSLFTSTVALTFGSLEKSFRLLLDEKRPLFVAR